jgi:plasmid stability protein
MKMKTLTIRNLDDEVFEQFTRRAVEQQRNAESHARFLIQQESKTGQLDTCGEILDDLLRRPAPKVELKKIERFQKERGRRSNRP